MRVINLNEEEALAAKLGTLAEVTSKALHGVGEVIGVKELGRNEGIEVTARTRVEGAS
jgi:hypothetical protein